MRQKIISIITLLFLTSYFFPTKTYAYESAALTSDITINSDTSLTIEEKIVYTTDKSKHGIYRYLPRTPKEIPQIISITDLNHHPYPYTKNTTNGNFVLKIGDPNLTFTGSKTYILTYTYKYPLKKIKNNYQLLWDITGEGWQFPLTQVSATIHSPAKILQANCYSGEFGSNDKLCQTKLLNDNTLKLTYPKPIDWNKNLTINLSLEPQPFTPPSLLWSFSHTYLPYFILLAPLILFVFYWYKHGRDYLPDQTKRQKGLFQHLTIPLTAYEPPKYLTPGQLGLLLDEKVDSQDIVAEIIELARLGYLKIEQTKHGFIFNKKDYRFTKLKDSDDRLRPYQAMLLKGIFKYHDSLLASSLKGTFYTTFDKVKDNLYKFTAKLYYTSNPQTARIKGIFLAFAGFAVIFFYFYLGINQNLFTSLGLAITILILNLIVIIILTFQLPQKTSLGTKMSLYAKGLRENLKRGAWRDKIKEKHLFLEEIIPYAIALGTVKQLAKAMKDLDLKPPEYLNSFVAANSLDSLARDLNNFSKSTASNLSYNPNSGSSGGSFSGGGGGGGGGGSW